MNETRSRLGQAAYGSDLGKYLHKALHVWPAVDNSGRGCWTAHVCAERFLYLELELVGPKYFLRPGACNATQCTTHSRDLMTKPEWEPVGPKLFTNDHLAW